MGKDTIRYQTLGQMYEKYGVEELKEINKFLFKVLSISGLRPAGLEIPTSAGKLSNRKADRIKWALGCLKDVYVLKYIYQKMMDPVEQAAIEELIHGTDTLDFEQFKAKYGKLPDMSLKGNYYRRRSSQDYYFPQVNLFIESDYIPEDIRKLFKDFVKQPQEVQSKTIDELPETVELYKGESRAYDAELVRHSTAQVAISDLQAMLRLADQGKIKVGAKTGHPTNASCKSILKVLSNGDLYPEDIAPDDDYDEVTIGDAGIRPFAWVMLLLAGGLVKINGSKLELTRNGKAALKKPAHEVLKHLWGRWLKNKNFHELRRVNIIKGQKSKKRPLYTAVDGRYSLEDALYELEPDKWIKTDDFFTFLVSGGLGFSIVRNAWPLYIGDSHYGSLGYGSTGWDKHIEGRFARAFLLEYAATLGLIDVALVPPWGSTNDHGDLWYPGELSCLSRYDGLYAFRLNSLGAWILNPEKEYIPHSKNESGFTVTDNMEITALNGLDELSSSDRLFLDRFSTPKSDKIWKLSLDKLLLAVEEGVELREIGEFLAARNQGALPEAVEDLLEDVNQRIFVLENKGDAVLLQCKEKGLASLIANDKVLKKICILAGKDHIVYYKNAESQFKKRLRELGYVC